MVLDASWGKSNTQPLQSLIKKQSELFKWELMRLDSGLDNRSFSFLNEAFMEMMTSDVGLR